MMTKQKLPQQTTLFAEPPKKKTNRITKDEYAKAVRRSPLEIALEHDLHLFGAGLPEWKPEYRFYPGRQWRFDFAFTADRVAVEIEGGTWTGGRHTRGSGFKSDCEKYNQAALLGWRVLRFTSSMITSGEAINTIKAALCASIDGNQVQATDVVFKSLIQEPHS